jgi:hypothetical protein
MCPIAVVVAITSSALPPTQLTMAGAAAMANAPRPAVSVIAGAADEFQ